MVEFVPPQVQAGIVDDPWSIVNGGARSISFASKDQYGNMTSVPVGTSFTGVTTAPPIASQQTNFDTRKPEYWDDGRPKMQLILELQTDLREDEDDDGIRRLYVKGQMLSAFRDEMKRLKIDKFGVGSRITVTLTGMKPPASGRGFPSKVYAVQIEPTQWSDGAAQALAQASAEWTSAAQPVQQAPVQQAPVQQAPVQQVPVQQVPVQQVPSTPDQIIQAAGGVPVVSPEALADLRTASKVIDLDTALTAVAAKHGAGDPGYREALGAAFTAENTPF